MEQKKKITITEVIECLDRGMKREDIAEHFNLSMRDVKKMFEHPKLKGKQARKPVEFELVDDSELEEDDLVLEQEDTGFDDPVEQEDIGTANSTNSIFSSID